MINQMMFELHKDANKELRMRLMSSGPVPRILWTTSEGYKRRAGVLKAFNLAAVAFGAADATVLFYEDFTGKKPRTTMYVVTNP